MVRDFSSLEIDQSQRVLLCGTKSGDLVEYDLKFKNFRVFELKGNKFGEQERAIGACGPGPQKTTSKITHILEHQKVPKFLDPPAFGILVHLLI